MMNYRKLKESIGLSDLTAQSTESDDVIWTPVSRLSQTIKYLQPWWPEYRKFWWSLEEYGLYTNDANQMWLYKHPRDDWRLLVYVLHDEVRFLYTKNDGTRQFTKHVVKRGWLECPEATPPYHRVPWALLLQVFVYARWAANGYDPEKHQTTRDIFKHFQRMLRDFMPIENLNG